MQNTVISMLNVNRRGSNSVCPTLPPKVSKREATKAAIERGFTFGPAWTSVATTYAAALEDAQAGSWSVYAMMVALSEGSDTVSVSHQDLAKYLSKDERVVSKAIRAIQTARLIEIVKRASQGKPAIYRFVAPQELDAEQHRGLEALRLGLRPIGQRDDVGLFEEVPAPDAGQDPHGVRVPPAPDAGQDPHGVRVPPAPDAGQDPHGVRVHLREENKEGSRAESAAAADESALEPDATERMQRARKALEDLGCSSHVAANCVHEDLAFAEEEVIPFLEHEFSRPRHKPITDATAFVRGLWKAPGNFGFQKNEAGRWRWLRPNSRAGPARVADDTLAKLKQLHADAERSRLASISQGQKERPIA